MTCLLWGGLLLCAIAIKRYWHQSRALLEGIGPGGAIVILAAILLMWLLAVSSWRHVVAACSGEKIPWLVAVRHLTLLLLGKYVPGGVWGFLARLSDSTTYGSLATMTAAGLVEQWIGLAMVSLLGGITLAAAYWKCWALLFGSILFPLIVLSSLRCANWALRYLALYLPARWRQAAGSISELGWGRQLWWAAILTMFQVMVILSVAGEVAAAAFHFEPYTAMAVAGCYGVGIMAGIAAIFMPGGILVRETVFVVLCRDWITPAEAIALAGGLRLTFTAFDLMAGAGGAFLQFWRRQHV
ncbi:lysylphosphatidylglycerol synthase domain-containing protein [Rhodanobacter sp. C01]|uniref:lysylphosphatidylglycerol synthase domain-containing protein n=1 Tax=Rhodanobacter sp. C01 TaxID=1945856 RepID=UPI001439E8DA|nr:lysylphosphatidylglycerol synthase domain-containing protein [Rhodanobacter sp. C01]